MDKMTIVDVYRQLIYTVMDYHAQKSKELLGPNIPNTVLELYDRCMENGKYSFVVVALRDLELGQAHTSGLGYFEFLLSSIALWEKSDRGDSPNWTALESDLAGYYVRELNHEYTSMVFPAGLGRVIEIPSIRNVLINLARDNKHPDLFLEYLMMVGLDITELFSLFKFKPREIIYVIERGLTGHYPYMANAFRAILCKNIKEQRL